MHRDRLTQIITGELPRLRSMGVHLDRTGLTMPEQLAYADWEHIGVALGQMGTGLQFALGDWLSRGEQAYRAKYRVASQLTGYEESSLKTFVWVANAILPSRRVDLSWAHHAEVAALTPEEQETVLSQAKEAGWSSRALRQALARSRMLTAGNGDGARDKPEEVVPEGEESGQASVSRVLGPSDSVVSTPPAAGAALEGDEAASPPAVVAPAPAGLPLVDVWDVLPIVLPPMPLPPPPFIITTPASPGGLHRISIPLRPGVYQALPATLEAGESCDDGLARLLERQPTVGEESTDGLMVEGGAVLLEVAVERVAQALTRQEAVLRRPEVRGGLRQIKQALVAWEEL